MKILKLTNIHNIMFWYKSPRKKNAYGKVIKLSLEEMFSVVVL